MLMLVLMLAAGPIDSVAWLQGCWALTDGQRVVEEQWMAPGGGIMLNMGRTVRAGKLVEYEHIVLREDGGKLAYEAHPSGQPSATFMSIEIGDAKVIFENAQHDFPQRVAYERPSPDVLAAWIEGTINGKTRRVEFPYTRVACPK
ncbi:MAG TPA: DUF6265 family protein [Vicinamibacterales bacterium]|nr:DUF6265 family protein [Vicinamibacterales bacterium]